jgi:hypothetical protein
VLTHLPKPLTCVGAPTRTRNRCVRRRCRRPPLWCGVVPWCAVAVRRRGAGRSPRGLHPPAAANAVRAPAAHHPCRHWHVHPDPVLWLDRGPGACARACVCVVLCSPTLRHRDCVSARPLLLPAGECVDREAPCTFSRCCAAACLHAAQERLTVHGALERLPDCFASPMLRPAGPTAVLAPHARVCPPPCGAVFSPARRAGAGPCAVRRPG